MREGRRDEVERLVALRARQRLVAPRGRRQGGSAGASAAGMGLRAPLDFFSVPLPQDNH
jgi:hypothetical protein